MRRLRLLAPVLFILASCSKPPDVVSLHASVVAAMQGDELEKAQGLLDSALGKGVLLLPPANPDTLIRPGISQSDADRLRLLQSEILFEQGNSPEAQKLLDHIPDPHDPELHLRWLIDQAFVLYRTGKSNPAQELLKKFDADSEGKASTELLLKADLLRAILLGKSGKLKSANSLLRETAAAAQRNGLPFYQGAALINLSNNSVQMRRYDESVDYSSQALATGNRRLAAGAQNNLDLAYYSLGNLEKAELHGRQAIDLSRKSGDALTLATSLGTLANVEIEQRKFDEAVKALEEARDLSIKNDSRIGAARWAGNLALAHLNAATSYNNSKEPDSSRRADSEFAAAEKANREAYELEKQLEHPENLPLLELNDAEIALGRNQLDEAERLYRKLIDEKPDGALEWMVHARLAKLLSLRNRIAEAKHEYELALTAIEGQRSNIDKTDSRIKFRDHLIRFFRNYVELLVTEKKYDEALEVVEYSRAREMAEKLGMKIDSIGQVRAAEFRDYARRSKVVLLSYWLAPDRSFVWAVDANGIHWGQLPDRKTVSNSIDAYRRMIEQDVRDPIAENLPQADDLSNMLLGPVKQYLKNADRVIVVLDSELHTLNLETLPDPSIPGKRYWIESTEFAVTPSLILLSDGKSAAKTPAASNLLLVGAATSTRAEYPELRGAKSEIVGIQQLFAGRNTIVEGANATPRVFLDSMPQNFSMIHFAAHAEANSESPLDSAVILSQGADGFKLYARDIERLNLSANLVSLSACYSAGARTYNGEGMVGFAWAFMQSGVRNVIAGLWDVDDTYSSRMMTNLYKGIASGQTPSKALREAKLELLHSSKGVPLKPVYWATYQTYMRY
jgi:CHAT domain-containing protein